MERERDLLFDCLKSTSELEASMDKMVRVAEALFDRLRACEEENKFLRGEVESLQADAEVMQADAEALQADVEEMKATKLASLQHLPSRAKGSD